MFIYTNNENTKDDLISKGFKLLSCQNGMYVFANNVTKNYDITKFSNVYFSDKLKF